MKHGTQRYREKRGQGDAHERRHRKDSQRPPSEGVNTRSGDETNNGTFAKKNHFNFTHIHSVQKFPGRATETSPGGPGRGSVRGPGQLPAARPVRRPGDPVLLRWPLLARGGQAGGGDRLG